MSANDALAELAGPPRDRWGRYLLPHPEHPDDKPRSFTRATTVAKAPEDQGGLIKWGQRTVVAGLGRRADLVALAATTDPTDKKALGQIARDAEEAGGAATGRNTGTAIHAAIEAVNRGDEPLPLFAEEVQAYRDALAARGLEPVSDLVERIVGDADRALARLSGPEPVLERELWLLVHKELRPLRRVAAVVDWIVATVRRVRPDRCG